jgi:hypothetical protein
MSKSPTYSGRLRASALRLVIATCCCAQKRLSLNCRFCAATAITE